MQTFLITLAAGCLGFCLQMGIAGAALQPDTAWQKLPPHPRLFADAARWTALKQQVTNDVVSRQIFAVVKNSAERVLDQPPVAYVDTGAFWHGPMRQAQGRILALALTYRLTGDARFLARAKLKGVKQGTVEPF